MTDVLVERIAVVGLVADDARGRVGAEHEVKEPLHELALVGRRGAGLDRDRQPAGVVLHQLGAALGGLDGGHHEAVLGGDAGQQGGLATRSGAQIQPAPAVGTDQRGPGQGAGHQLAALVLHQRLTVADRRQPSGITGGEVHRIRRIAADGAVHLFGQRLGGQHAGPRRQVYGRPGVVGRQRRVELAGVGAEGVGESLGDPARVGMHEGGVADGVAAGRWGQLGQPGLLVAAGDAAQHAVDETRSGGVEFDAGLVHGGGDGGMLLDAGA